jgi:hypothetical protein
MKLGQNPWMIICLVAAIMTLSLLSVSVAQDQNLPEGKDKGVWVLIDTKPDVEAEKDWDNGAYYNNHVSLSGSTIEGGYSWKDGDDPDDCKGTVKGRVSWTELPGVLEPGVKQETTITAEASGKQSCSARHPGACAHLEINEVSLEPHPCVSFSSGDKKQDAEIAKVSWEAPWGKIGDTLTLTVNNRVSGSLPAYIHYIYSYQAKAPAVPPKPSETVPQHWGSIEIEEPIEKPSESVKKEDCPPCNKSNSLGHFSNIARRVEVFPDCDPDALKPASPRTELCDGDHVVTGEDSSAVIAFRDLSTLLIKAESEVVVRGPPKEPSMIEIMNGRFWVNINKVIRGEPIEVKSVLVRTGIEGTTFVFEASESESRVKVLDGKVSLTSTVTGKKAIAIAGEMVIATINGLSLAQPFDVEAENASWNKLIPEGEAIGSSPDNKDIYGPTGHTIDTFSIGLENNIDRPGMDYRNFDLPSANPSLCQNDCRDDPNCRAFTYVRPGYQGNNARCWLKDEIPAAVPSQCCISGKKVEQVPVTA